MKRHRWSNEEEKEMFNCFLWKNWVEKVGRGGAARQFKHLSALNKWPRRKISSILKKAKRLGL